jgi:hypothetical protein
MKPAGGAGAALQPTRMNIAMIKTAGYTMRLFVFTMLFSLKSKYFDDLVAAVTGYAVSR